MISSKTILVIADDAADRKILVEMLSLEYTVLSAENGKEALNLLQQQHSSVAAVLLDISMSDMDGYEFLRAIQQTPYAEIPIIVATENRSAENELQILDMGVWDVIVKPYNMKILKSRLKNIVLHSELLMLGKLKYFAEFDTLTGIYNKAKFFTATRAMIDTACGERFAFVRFDVDRFKLINSFYGIKSGDNLLKSMADTIKKYAYLFSKITYGRIEADEFALCFTYEKQEEIISIIQLCQNNLKGYSINFDIVAVFGIYLLEDHSMPIHKMLDNAKLAAKQIKGNYIKTYEFYTSELSRKLETEQKLINEMNIALEQQQFCLYLQPKYSLHTNLPTGAEALVRWQHPLRGLIPPGVFIPVFEKNGFITKLDAYMWDKTCQLLRQLIDQGLSPQPISVNVSRVNLYNAKLVENFCALTEKYKIPKRLLHLELTESAYTDNPQIIKTTLARLHEKGFVVIMDDFGSGYSSLNILKDIDIDILKIDMKFFGRSDIPGRGENIVASVVRMAKWLNIQTIAEGVELPEQIEFLSSIGCECVQGYYYAKPMPIDQYIELIKREEAFIPQDKPCFDANGVWTLNSHMQLLFSNITQAVTIYEYEEDCLEVLMVNRAFYDIFGFEDPILHKMDPLAAIKSEYHELVLNAFRVAANTKGKTSCEYQRKDDIKGFHWIRMELKYLYSIGEKSILLSTLFDIQAQKAIEQELQKYRYIINRQEEQLKVALIVDDEECNRVILNEIFKDDYIILQATNGKQALQVLAENQNSVDIILLDLLMPEMDGIAFLEYKKEHQEIADIPVVIITADDSADQQINTLALGANDYIVKPFVPEVVRRRVENVSESNQRFRQMLNEYNSVAKQAQIDVLTGIYNRSAMKSLISQRLTRISNQQHALLMIDVDHLKHINDTYGHGCGDLVLIAVAEKLKHFFRKNDIVSRCGGDEFIVFMHDIISNKLVLQKCVNLCNQIGEINIGYEAVVITVSIGIAITALDVKQNLQTLYDQADAALYQAKKQGRNRAVLFQ